MIAPTEIIFHHIRNCTEKLTYCGMNFLIDPFFTPKGYYPGFEMCPSKEQKKFVFRWWTCLYQSKKYSKTSSPY